MKIIKLTLSFLFAFLSFHFANAQKNSIYAEFGGNAFSYYSINYDRIIKLTDQLKIAPRFGVSYLPIKKLALNEDYGNFRIPLEVNLLWGKNPEAKKFAEVGIGLSLIQMKIEPRLFEADRPDYYKFSRTTFLRLGFRHQRPTGGLMYRAGLLARVAQDSFSKQRFGNISYQLYPGASIGYSF